MKELEDVTDGDRNTDKRAWWRNVVSAEIFYLTLLFSLPLGLVVAFGRMSKIAPVRWISKIIHINYERNTADVAAYGGVFRTLLSVWSEFPQDIV